MEGRFCGFDFVLENSMTLGLSAFKTRFKSYKCSWTVLKAAGRELLLWWMLSCRVQHRQHKSEISHLTHLDQCHWYTTWIGVPPGLVPGVHLHWQWESWRCNPLPAHTHADIPFYWITQRLQSKSFGTEVNLFWICNKKKQRNIKWLHTEARAVKPSC